MATYKQTSFAGGMNLLLDDTRLPVSFKYKEGDTPYDITYNQYRLGINSRTRFDIVESIQSSFTDLTAPSGVKQGIVVFGNYVILFVAGTAWYRLGTQQQQWTQIDGFNMDKGAPRYWTVEIPVNTTNYGRIANTTGGSGIAADAAAAQLPVTQIAITAGSSSFGLNPGILVQDGINQPQFIFVDFNGTIQCRITQTYSQWSFPLDTDTLLLTGPDNREYVPIGTYMEYFQGILFIVDPSFTFLYRSVSGRPLDFVVNVDEEGQKGGDASTTSYSVGVAGITAIKAISNALFVAAGGSSTFFVTLNQTPGAPMIFGEYTFNRQVLFNANCISERGIVSVAAGLSGVNSPDTLFIDASGVRSFNAVETLQNEGRNSVFSSTVQSLFNKITQLSAQTADSSPVGWSSAVNFNDFAIFSVNTVFGYVLVVYDTINNVYQSIDINQLGNHAAKQFAAINITTLALWCITDDDRVVQLYSADTEDSPTIRLGAICTQNPDKELKVTYARAIFTNITKDMLVTASLFVNNRFDSSSTIKVAYSSPTNTWTGTSVGTDVGTQTNSLFFAFPNSGQGWKAFIVLSWTGGASLNSTLITTTDLTPMNPLMTQAVTNGNS